MNESRPGRTTKPPHDTPPAALWPRPSALSLLLVLVWLVGVAVATVVPWFIVAPTAVDPEPGEVWLAAAISVAGIAIFTGAGVGEYLHTRSRSVLTWALIPGVAVGAGVLIFTATLLAV
ncbi:MAG: hypothetical protein ACFCVF_16645 [Kineosporiaceae bacterium]